jgi:hypothetical protein
MSLSVSYHDITAHAPARPSSPVKKGRDLVGYIVCYLRYVITIETNILQNMSCCSLTDRQGLIGTVIYYHDVPTEHKSRAIITVVEDKRLGIARRYPAQT